MNYNIDKVDPLVTYGVIGTKFSDAQLAPIKSEIENIEKNFDLYVDQKNNSRLAGNIKREYRLTESKKYIEDLLAPLVRDYDKRFEYIQTFSALTNNVPIVLSDVWVNFQKKYEFNPLHNHRGLLSFVLWTNVPYDMDEERRLSPGAESNLNSAGMFSFVFANTFGGIKEFSIPVNKNMENRIVLFPSSFMHLVYPFFSSDGYRISVSGNFKLKID